MIMTRQQFQDIKDRLTQAKLNCPACDLGYENEDCRCVEGTNKTEWYVPDVEALVKMIDWMEEQSSEISDKLDRLLRKLDV